MIKKYAYVIQLVALPLLAGLGLSILVLISTSPASPLVSMLTSAAGFVAICTLVMSFLSIKIDADESRRKISAAEDLVRNNPDKPQLAWELAQAKLESYLSRNLAQVQWIFWLTIIVMLAGFSLITYGLIKGFANPDSEPMVYISAASGVLVSFIGGSFLLVFRATMDRSSEFVVVLERINAVGMAVQIVNGLPESAAKLRNESTAAIASQLLGMYSNTVAPRVKAASQRRPRSARASSSDNHDESS